MTQHPSESEGLLSPRAERRWFRRSALVLLALYFLIGLGVAWSQRRAKLQEREDARALLDPAANDPGVTPAERVDAADAVLVTVGIYLDRVTELTIKEESWKPVFDVWFRWHGTMPSPAENLVMVDGGIDSREKLAEFHQGDDHFERYRIAATITKQFSIAHFPLDEQLLLIGLENGAKDRRVLRFVADRENSSVSSRVQFLGYNWTAWKLLEKPHSYKTTRGDPRHGSQGKATFSQLRFGLMIRRSGWGIYFKMFNALYVSVAVALVAFFIKPIHVDPRFGLGVGGLFASVANSYLVGSYVPDTGELSLADIVNSLGILTILVTIVVSTLSLFLYEKYEERDLSRRVDMMAFNVVLCGFLGANLAALLATL
jgi:hypothetical protein